MTTKHLAVADMQVIVSNQDRAHGARMMSSLPQFRSELLEST
jgi:hypothetical protein